MFIFHLFLIYHYYTHGIDCSQNLELNLALQFSGSFMHLLFSTVLLEKCGIPGRSQKTMIIRLKRKRWSIHNKKIYKTILHSYEFWDVLWFPYFQLYSQRLLFHVFNKVKNLWKHFLYSYSPGSPLMIYGTFWCVSV